MGAISQTSPNQFEVRFDAVGGLVERLLGGKPQAVDPYRIAQAIAEVMRGCTVRSAGGKRLVWNEYRVILAQADFAQLRALESYLQRDLAAVLSEEARRLGGELVGELCVHVISDESAELGTGRGVIRVGFVPTAQLSAPQHGEMTVRLGAVAGIIQGARAAPDVTVGVSDSVELDPSLAPYHLDWPGGSVPLALGVRVTVGRPHPGHPADFVALTGASTKINKQHAWVIAMASRAVVGRMADANPVHVDGVSLGAGEERELTHPEIQISLSRGELMLRLHRTTTSR
jgi:hypothetical protein